MKKTKKQKNIYAYLLVISIAFTFSCSLFPQIAHATKFKTSVEYIIAMFNSSNEFGSNTFRYNDLYQRARLNLSYMQNENLSLKAQIESATSLFGTYSFDQSAPVELREFYLDYKEPRIGLGVRIGTDTTTAPYAFGNGSPVFDAPVSGVSVSLSLTPTATFIFEWNRLSTFVLDFTISEDELDDEFIIPIPGNPDGQSFLGNELVGNNSANFWMISLPLQFSQGTATPYFLYSHGGANTEYFLSTNGEVISGFNGWGEYSAWWAGLSIDTFVFSPFEIKTDIAFARGFTNMEDEFNGAFAGLWYDVLLSYTGLKSFIPELFGIYVGGGYRSLDGDFEPPSSFFGGSSFQDLQNSSFDNLNGYWMTGVRLRDIKLTESISTDFLLTYTQGLYEYGTDADGKQLPYFSGQFFVLGKNDSVATVEINTSYNFLEYFTAILELGYAYNSFDHTSPAFDSVHSARVAAGIIMKF